MKILRGPSSTGNWTQTDSRSPRDYAREWRPGTAIEFDGTIDKDGQRHTILGVELDERDVIALHGALLKYYKERVQERDQMARTVEDLRDVLRKISRLVSEGRYRAPNTEEILSAVKEVAEHYAYGWMWGGPFKPKFRWLDWSSL